jgi:hypothetical protein
MLRKSPTLAKSARMGHPTSKAKSAASYKPALRTGAYIAAAMVTEWKAVRQTAGRDAGKK